MKTIVNDTQIKTLEQVRQFLEGTGVVGLTIDAKDDRYVWILHTLIRFHTGWPQIRYPYGATVEDVIQELQYDLYYVKSHSLFLDLIILFQTAQVVLFGKGAC